MASGSGDGTPRSDLPYLLSRPDNRRGTLRPQSLTGVFCCLPHLPYCPTYVQDFPRFFLAPPPCPALILLLFYIFLLGRVGRVVGATPGRGRDLSLPYLLAGGAQVGQPGPG